MTNIYEDLLVLVQQDPFPALDSRTSKSTHWKIFDHDFMPYCTMAKNSHYEIRMIIDCITAQAHFRTTWNADRYLQSYYNNPIMTDDIHVLPYDQRNPGFLLSNHQELKSLFESFLASKPQRRAAQRLGQDFAEATPFNSDVVSIITSYLITNGTETHHKATNQMILNHFNSASKPQSATAQIQDRNRKLLCTIL